MLLRFGVQGQQGEDEGTWSWGATQGRSLVEKIGTAVSGDLKIHAVGEMNGSTFEALLPKMSKITPLVIEKGFTMGSHQKKLLETIKERDMTVIMKDCDAGDLRGYAAVSPHGKYVVVKNSCSGRRQHLLVFNDERNFELAMAEVADEATARHPPKNSNTNESFTREEAERGWEHHTILTLESYYAKGPRDAKFPDWLNDRLGKGHLKAFCTIHISLYATHSPPQKWIKFKLTDAVGMSAKMGTDDNWAKGWFNHSAGIYLFPGSGKDRDCSHLPSGWSRPNMEPHTPNLKTTYTSTTGWHFGLTAGADLSGPGGKVKADYSQSNQEQCAISDFNVQNISDGAMTGWKFYYTAVDGENWRNHFRAGNAPKEIADSAKSTLTLNAETVYMGPPDVSEELRWNFQIFFKWAALRGHAFFCDAKWTEKALSDISMTIDTGKVQSPSSVKN